MLFKTVTKYYSPQGESAMPLLTIDNCEPYLLLYIDNELTVSEKQVVEIFLQKEPAAVALLQELQATILEIDRVETDKLSLYKSAEITAANFEEMALFAIDNELSTIDFANFHAYLASNASAKEAFDTLQKTKLNDTSIGLNKLHLQKHTLAGYATPISALEALLLQVDNENSATQQKAVAALIASNRDVAKAYSQLEKVRLGQEQMEFPNKESLYRKEKNRAPIIPIWMRYAAAAAIIIGALFIGINNNGKDGDIPGEIVKVNPVNKVDSNNNTSANTSLPSDVVTTTPNNTTTTNTGDVKQFVKTDLFNSSKSKSPFIATKVVKNELTRNNNVTNNKEPRITNTNGNTPTVLSKNDDEKVFVNNTANKIGMPENKTPVTNLPSINTVSIASSKVVVTYTAPNVEEAELSEISIAGIPIEKIDKKNKSGNIKKKLTGLLAKAKKEISDREITIAGYDIALSTKKTR